MQALECTICSETYNRDPRCPKVLQCGHTFCGECLSDWENRSLNGIECFKCRRVERRRVVDIPLNFDTLDYLEAHIDPRLKELVEQNSDFMAQAQRLLDDYQSNNLSVLKDNKRKIDDFNIQIMEVIQIIERFRDSVNEDYNHITKQNETSLQPCIIDLQNYVNSTAASIRQANQLIENLDADFNDIQAMFSNRPPTFRAELESFNLFGAEKLKNLKQLVLLLSTKDHYLDPPKASLTVCPPLNIISISTPVPDQPPNLFSGPSFYPAQSILATSFPIPAPNLKPSPEYNPIPTHAPNKIPEAPYQIPNKVPNQIPSPEHNPIANAAPNKKPNQDAYQIPNKVPYQMPNHISNLAPNMIPCQAPYRIANPPPNPIHDQAQYRMPNPAPNPIHDKAPYQIPNQAQYRMPNPAPNPIHDQAPHRITNQVPYQIPNPAPYQVYNPGPNLAGPLPKQHKEQWYFHIIKEKRFVPFDFHNNQLIIDAKLRGVNDVLIRSSDGEIKGTVKLDRMKFYLSNNIWYPIQFKSIE